MTINKTSEQASNKPVVVIPASSIRDHWFDRVDKLQKEREGLEVGTRWKELGYAIDTQAAFATGYAMAIRELKRANPGFEFKDEAETTNCDQPDKTESSKELPEKAKTNTKE